MLRPLALVDQFNAIENGLPGEWADARLVLSVADAGRCDRAAAMLGPANPGRRQNNILFTVARRGGGIAPEAARRLLRRLDGEGVSGKLALVGAETAPAAEIRARTNLRASWELGLASLPPDWSDLYAEVRLDSTDFVERAALLLAPVNPSRYGGATGLRFRCARSFGYGVSPEMAARCLERCDDEGITGEVEILRALSDTHPVGTQGPVWLVGGRSV
jgi:hypothetical protein